MAQADLMKQFLLPTFVIGNLLHSAHLLLQSRYWWAVPLRKAAPESPCPCCHPLLPLPAQSFERPTTLELEWTSEVTNISLVVKQTAKRRGRGSSFYHAVINCNTRVLMLWPGKSLCIQRLRSMAKHILTVSMFMHKA